MSDNLIRDKVAQTLNLARGNSGPEAGGNKGQEKQSQAAASPDFFFGPTAGGAAKIFSTPSPIGSDS
jgi:hypothetical protein